MTRLVLVRHGQTEWHADNRYAGISDVELTAQGLEQARLLGKWAATAELAEIWCSPLSRAWRTAQVCESVTGLPLRVDDRLRELDFGAGEGLTVAEMRSRIPGELAAFERDPVAHHLPGGEDPNAAATRFVAALDDITLGHPDRRVLVVGHTTVIRLALCRLAGVPLREYRSLFPFIRNCGITEIRRDGAVTALLEFNTPIEPTV